jgi:hypothetical protein
VESIALAGFNPSMLICQQEFALKAKIICNTG